MCGGGLAWGMDGEGRGRKRAGMVELCGARGQPDGGAG